MNEIVQEFNEITKNLLESVKLDQIRKDYNEKGYVIFERIFSEQFCDEIILAIENEDQKEQLNEKKFAKEINYAGTELRIWNADKKGFVFEEFKHFSDKVSSEIFSKEMDAFNILAIRNRSIKNVDKDVSSGRWHIDSFVPQFKAFLFLTTTDEDSGPFEFIPGSNKFPFKLKSALKGEYFSPKDFVKGGRKYQHISNEYVDIVKQAEPSMPLLVSKGTLVFIDTSCLHRARPCLKGERYALTSYYK